MPNIYPYGVIASIESTLHGGKVEVQSLLHSFHLFIIKYREPVLPMIEIKYEKLPTVVLCKMYKLDFKGKELGYHKIGRACLLANCTE